MSQQFLNNLSKALSEKNRLTKAHTQRYRKRFALNRNAAGFNDSLKELIYTLVVDQADGAYIQDLDGHTYLDVTMGFGVHLFGHKPAFLETAIAAQVEQGFPLGPISPLAGEVADGICRMTGVERVAFFNSGTEAIMVALRLAKAATQKTHFVFFKGAYHGTFDSLLSMKCDRQSNKALELVPGVTQNTLDESYLLNYGDESALDFIEQHADHLAAVLVEPVQSRRPELQPANFLRQLRQITQKKDIALIFDEVITGFRISPGGAQEHFEIKADLVTYGKVIGGGIPIGVVAGNTRFMDPIDGGHWSFGDASKPTVKATFVAGTFCHHPLAMAAAKRVLAFFEADQGALQKRLNQVTAQFSLEMNQYFQKEDLPIEIVHFGSLFRFKLRGHARLLFYQLLLDGVYIWEGRNCFFSMAHTEEDIQLLKERIIQGCRILMEAGVIKVKSK